MKIITKILTVIVIATLLISCDVKSKKFNPDTFEEDVNELTEEEKKKVRAIVKMAIVFNEKDKIEGMTYEEIIKKYDNGQTEVTQAKGNDESEDYKNNGLIDISIDTIIYTEAFECNSGGLRYPDEEGLKWAIITLTVRNISGKTLENFAPWLATTIQDNEGAMYPATITCEFPKRLKTLNVITKSFKATGNLSFCIPNKNRIVALNWHGWPYTYEKHVKLTVDKSIQLEEVE